MRQGASALKYLFTVIHSEGRNNYNLLTNASLLQNCEKRQNVLKHFPNISISKGWTQDEFHDGIDF